MFKSKNFSRRKAITLLGVSSIGLGVNSINKLFSSDKMTHEVWKGEVLNGPARVEIHSSDKSKNKHLISKIKKKLIQYENVFNLQNENSEISILNRNKFIDNPSKHLIDVVNKSLYMAEKTNGLFDLTVQPLWNLYYDHFIIKGNSSGPEEELVFKTKKLVNYNNVQLKNNNISLIGNSSITLNGIAQGWITDEITKILKENGIQNTLIDLGEMYALGKFNNLRSWNILLSNTNYSKVINLTNKALATSAGNGTSFEPTNKYHHIFNPKTGHSSNNFKSVSVLAEKAWISDALSTASVSMKKNELKKVCKIFSAEAYVLEKNKYKKLV